LTHYTATKNSFTLLEIIIGQEKIHGLPVQGWRGGVGAGAGRLSNYMHLSGPSRGIELLYAPAPPPLTVWALKPPSWALHLLGLSLANICVRTRRYAGMHTLASPGWALIHKTTYAHMIYTSTNNKIIVEVATLEGMCGFTYSLLL
jgi:hypothetical protein